MFLLLLSFYYCSFLLITILKELLPIWNKETIPIRNKAPHLELLGFYFVSKYATFDIIINTNSHTTYRNIKLSERKVPEWFAILSTKNGSTLNIRNMVPLPCPPQVQL
jgi:hypothetical protein